MITLGRRRIIDGTCCMHSRWERGHCSSRTAFFSLRPSFHRQVALPDRPSVHNQPIIAKIKRQLRTQRPSISVSSFARCLFLNLTVLPAWKSIAKPSDEKAIRPKRTITGVHVLVRTATDLRIDDFSVLRSTTHFVSTYSAHACAYKASQRLRSTASVSLDLPPHFALKRLDWSYNNSTCDETRHDDSRESALQCICVILFLSSGSLFDFSYFRFL